METTANKWESAKNQFGVTFFTLVGRVVRVDSSGRSVARLARLATGADGSVRVYLGFVRDGVAFGRMRNGATFMGDGAMCRAMAQAELDVSCA